MVSQNGWSASPSASNFVPFKWITGRVRPGGVKVIFDYLCRRFDAEVEKINPAHSWGWNFRAIRGASRLSNHASGTAIDLNAPKHPLGAVNTFTKEQVKAIRSILAALDGVVRWGGDYSGRKDEMHFEIVGSPAQVDRVAARLLNPEPTPAVTPASTSSALPIPDMEDDDMLIIRSKGAGIWFLSGNKLAPITKPEDVTRLHGGKIADVELTPETFAEWRKVYK